MSDVLMNRVVSSKRTQPITYGVSGSATCVAVASFLRGLPLFFADRPKTPLRALCIIAFDTLYRLRYSTCLPTARIRTLSVLLDFAACANAICDGKRVCPQEFATTRRLLEAAGKSESVREYLRRLQELEDRRPSPANNAGQLQSVVAYREDVVRLSLGLVAAMAEDSEYLDEGTRAITWKHGLQYLFLIVMQCQIIDDLFDYALDKSAGLPSFLNTGEPLPQVLVRTSRAAAYYADTRDLPPTADRVPWGLALFAVSICARLAILLKRCHVVTRGFVPFRSLKPWTD